MTWHEASVLIGIILGAAVARFLLVLVDVLLDRRYDEPMRRRRGRQRR